MVGPVCESADVLAKRRRLPLLQAGDLVALRTAGAYGMAMASQYNARPRPRAPAPSPGDDGPSPGEWRTPPLWGVADSAPYMHDGRAANLEQAIVMHGGHVVESQGVRELFAHPQHPYTRGLLQSIPRLESPPKQRLPVIEWEPEAAI